MYDVRRVPVWGWVLVGAGVLLVVRTRVSGRVQASVAEPVFAEAGGPPSPYSLPPEYTHSCPVEWTGRYGWSPNVTGEWLLYGNC